MTRTEVLVLVLIGAHVIVAVGVAWVGTQVLELSRGMDDLRHLLLAKRTGVRR